MLLQPARGGSGPNGLAERLEALLADAIDFTQLVDRAKSPVGLAEIDYPARERGTNSVEGLQLLDGGRRQAQRRLRARRARVRLRPGRYCPASTSATGGHDDLLAVGDRGREIDRCKIGPAQEATRLVDGRVDSCPGGHLVEPRPPDGPRHMNEESPGTTARRAWRRIAAPRRVQRVRSFAGPARGAPLVDGHRTHATVVAATGAQQARATHHQHDGRHDVGEVPAVRDLGHLRHARRRSPTPGGGGVTI